MLIHRVLDVFFRSLDTIDAAKDKIDRLRGKSPQPDPWAVDWPPADADLPKAHEAKQENLREETRPPEKPVKKPEAQKAVTKQTTKSASKKSKVKKKTTKRKGSVDRSGKDLKSDSAEKAVAHLKTSNKALINESAELDGKKVLARVVWALSLSHDAGIDGMTTKDISALLSSAVNIEVFATNVGRACRDHSDFIEVASTKGRSKTYRLSDAGHKRVSDIA